VSLIGRLAPGASIEHARAELDGLAGQLEAAFPETNKGRGMSVREARGIRIENQDQHATIVALLAGASMLVLLVASANVAGLLLARGLRRRKEIAIRLALGSSHARLVRLLLVESVVMAVAGSLAGVIVAIWSTEVLRGFFGVGSSGAFNLDLSLDPRVLLTGITVAVLTGLLTGIAPALQATRSDPMLAMKEEAAGAGARRSRLREGLIVVQVALSVVLLGDSGLLVRSFLMLHRGPGFDPNAVALVRLRPSLVGYSNDRSWAFQREVIARLQALPGVIAASPADVPPLPGWNRQRVPAHLAGRPNDPAHEFRTATTRVGPRYFKTLGVTVMEGREFDDHDRPDGKPVVVVNEALARQLWPNGGAVASFVTLGPTRYEVVGIVKDQQWLTVLDSPQPIAYLNFWQQDRTNAWSNDSRTHIRVSGDASAMLPEIQRAISAIDPDVPIAESTSLGASLDYQFASVRAARTMLVVFGAVTLVLSAIGLYAALAYAVGQRTREIAVRMALGASRADVGRLVFNHGGVIVGIGLGGGLVACVGAGPYLAHLLYGVSPRDPYALMAGPTVLAVVVLLAMWLPARRAMSLNPTATLRAE
jgi:predicted permease